MKWKQNGGPPQPHRAARVWWKCTEVGRDPQTTEPPTDGPAAVPKVGPRWPMTPRACGEHRCRRRLSNAPAAFALTSGARARPVGWPQGSALRDKGPRVRGAGVTRHGGEKKRNHGIYCCFGDI